MFFTCPLLNFIGCGISLGLSSTKKREEKRTKTEYFNAMNRAITKLPFYSRFVSNTTRRFFSTEAPAFGESKPVSGKHYFWPLALGATVIMTLQVLYEERSVASGHHNH